MRKNKFGILTAAIALLLTTGVASAQTYTSDVSDRVMPSTDLAGEWYLGPHIGYIFLGDDDEFRCDCDLDQSDYIKFGGRLGYYLTNHFALEATANYMNLHPDYWELTLGGLYNFTPRYPGWNTYLGFGGGVAGEDPFSDAVPIAYLALGSEYRFNKLLGLRLEARGNYSFETDLEDEFGEFTQDSRFDFEPTIGLLFHFGGRAAPTVIVPAPVPPAPPEPPPADGMERRTAEASRQRIVALRLVASGERWNGSELRAALEAEGLSFGPYSIFHREREDGKSLLYVASMMEPGSFDLESMDEQDFPGVSLFGVVPGPLDAPSTFDLVLTVGRGLAGRLAGQLQDEQGSTLTAQRILNLREELVHFEHRSRRLRRN